MNRFLVLLLLASGLFATESSLGAVFERDWKTRGDGLLTYDDVNQREWLDLTESVLFDFPGNDIESRYQSVAAEVAPGGLFEGFTIPTSNLELVAFGQSAGLNTTTVRPAITNLAVALNLISLLGETSPLGAGTSLTVGFYEQFVTPPLLPAGRVAGSVFHSPQDGRNGSSGLRISTVALSDGVFDSSAGVFLYRNVIPEPNSIALCTVCLFLLCIFDTR